MLIVVLIVCILWAFFSKADIPLTACTKNISTFTPSSSVLPVMNLDDLESQACTDTELTIDVSLVIFLMASITFIGMWLTVIFGGVGIFALPLDFIYSYTRRPKKKSAS